MDAATEPPTGAASTRAEELDARSQYIAHLHATVVPAGLDLRAARKRPLWQESNEILEARTTASRARLLWALGVRADITADDLVVWWDHPGSSAKDRFAPEGSICGGPRATQLVLDRKNARLEDSGYVDGRYHTVVLVKATWNEIGGFLTEDKVPAELAAHLRQAVAYWRAALGRHAGTARGGTSPEQWKADAEYAVALDWTGAVLHRVWVALKPQT